MGFAIAFPSPNCFLHFFGWGVPVIYLKHRKWLELNRGPLKASKGHTPERCQNTFGTSHHAVHVALHYQSLRGSLLQEKSSSGPPQSGSMFVDGRVLSCQLPTTTEVDNKETNRPGLHGCWEGKMDNATLLPTVKF